MKKALIIALAILPLVAFSQDNVATKTQKPLMVSVKAKATDARAVIADLFTQAKVNFVLQPGIQAALFLSLENVEFEEALNIVCVQAHLQYDVQNGIYFISKKPVPPPAPATPKGTLDKEVLTHKLTVKFLKTDLRSVLAEFAKQSAVAIDVDKTVPNYKLDATLRHSTLRAALDKVTEAAGLKYRFTDTLSILIYKPADDNKVAVSGN